MCYSPGPLYRCQRIVNKAERREQEGSVLVGVHVCVCVCLSYFFFFPTSTCVCVRVSLCERSPLCAYKFFSFSFSFFFFSSHVVFVCMTVCGCAPAPFGLYPKAVLQARETSERERKSLGRLWDVSREHLSPATNPPTKLKEAPMKPYEAFMRARQGPDYPQPLIRG